MHIRWCPIIFRRSFFGEGWGFLFPSHITKGNIMCMRLLFSWLLCCLLLSGSILSQEPDTAKTYQVGEVVITATRSQIPRSDSPSQIDVIQKEELRSVSGSTVADALLQETAMFL